MRQPAFAAATAITMIVALYMGLVGFRAFAFIRSDSAAAQALGWGLALLPAIGIWYLVVEWRLGTTVQKMADQLEREGRLPLHDGERLPSGRLTDEAAADAYEVARMGVEANPDDWAAWFHVAYAYEAGRDRPMARKSLRHAAELYRKQRRAERVSGN